MIEEIKQTAQYASAVVQYKYDQLKHKKHRSPQWDEFSNQFLWEFPLCAACGTYEKVVPHHIKPFHLFPELELEKSNLVSLCMKKGRLCHLLIGHAGNFKYWNPNVIGDAALALKRPEEFEFIVALAKRARKL